MTPEIFFAVIMIVTCVFLILITFLITCALDDLQRISKRLEALERARQIFCQDLFERLKDDLEDAIDRLEEK